MRRRTREALVDRLSAYDSVVELAVGRRPDVAASLADRGVDVAATDVVDRSVPDPVRFFRDDVTEPTQSIYQDADALYALNLPPELHRPAWQLARTVDAAFLFTTLGGDGPEIPVHPRMLPGETLYEPDPERA